MDRRSALKKLAAGTALASGASVVVSSTAVALGGSGPCLDPASLPGATLPLGYSGADDQVVLTASDAPVCNCGGLTRTYNWTLVSYSLQGTLTDIVVMTQLASNSVRLERFQVKNDGSLQRKKLKSGDQYTVTVQISWQCSPGDGVVKTYRIAGTYDNVPTSTLI